MYLTKTSMVSKAARVSLKLSFVLWLLSIGGTNVPLHAAIRTWTGVSSGNWTNGDATNWSGTYNNGDDVNFNDGGFNSAITIGANVAPASITFNNSSVAYSFTGSALAGSGSITVNGTGSTTFLQNNMIPDLSAVTIASGSTLNINPVEIIGSLAGGGNLVQPPLNQNDQITFGVNDLDTAFSGLVTGNLGGSGFIRKVGKGRMTYTGAGFTDSNSNRVTIMDGTMVVAGAGVINGTTVTAGAKLIVDDTGTQVVDRLKAFNLGGEVIVQGNASANTVLGPVSNTQFLINMLGAPTLTLNPGDGFQAQYQQGNGGNNGFFSVSEGNTFLVRGDGLGQTSGTRSKLTLRTNDLSILLLGGAGATFSDDAAGQAGTPQVSVLYRTYVDNSSTGFGNGFATYDRGGDHSQNSSDPGVRPLTASEYSNSLTDGDGAVVTTIANTRLNSAVTGINSATRINSLVLEQGGSIAGSGGTLTVHSGLIMSTGTNGAITTTGLDVPSITQSGTFAGFASVTHNQLSLITPKATDQLLISSNISIAGSSGLVKSGNGTVILTGNNTYTGFTTISGGSLRAQSGTGLPTASNLRFTGGILESSGTFNRGIGTGANQVHWLNGSSGFADGGFAAVGGDLDIQLNGGTGAVTWNATNFVAGNRALLLSSKNATHVVDFQNNLNLASFNGTTGLTRVVRVEDNLASANDRAVMSGVISGSDGSVVFRKEGAGLLELTGNNTYLGQTQVAEGTLLVNGTTAGQGNYSVLSGATLGGTGTIGLASTAMVEIEDGGILSAGDGGAGTLEIGGDLLLNENSILSFDLVQANTVGSPNDLIVVNGDLTLDGILDIDSLGELDFGTYRLFNYTGTLTNNGLLGLDSGFILDTSVFGQVNLLVVPEPSSLALLGFGLLGMVRRRRRGQNAQG